MSEPFSKLFGSVLRRVIAQYATKYYKFELLDVCRLQCLLCSHVHEANVLQILAYLSLQKLRNHLCIVLVTPLQVSFGRCKLLE